MKPMPAFLMQRATQSAFTSIFTPRTLSTSAEPVRLLAERAPCLAIGTPIPAAISAAAVEMLNVALPSPPVPQVSTVSGGAATRTEDLRMTVASAAGHGRY